MAKKTSKKNKKKIAVIENALPQNILRIGERVQEDKNIYISQPVYKKIHNFTQNKTTNESGGMLIGNVIEEFGKTNIIINGFVEAKYCEATPTTLKFTHETWEYVHKEIDKNFAGQKIVGWIHTHPNFGIFLSEYDKFIQKNFFKEDYQIAYVVDPVQNIEGFYFWINGNIERCNGFYKFDKTGTNIESDVTDKEDTAEQSVSSLNFKNIIIAALIVCIAFLGISNIIQNDTIEKLQKQHATFQTKVNQTLSYMQGRIEALQVEINNLMAQLDSVRDAEADDIITDTNEEESNLPETESEAQKSSGTQTTEEVSSGSQAETTTSTINDIGDK